MATKLFQPERLTITPQFWTAAEGLPVRRLRAYLCDEALETGGKYCRICESQCAFGKRLVDENRLVRKGTKTIEMVCSMMDADGKVVKRFNSMTSAAKYVSGNCTGVRRSVMDGRSYKDRWFKWEKKNG